MASKADKFTQIADPAQRVLAAKVSEICDIFFAGFAELEPEDRLVDIGAAEDAAGRVRNLLRILALGAVVHLGRELGIPMCDLYGQPTRNKPAVKRGDTPERHRASTGGTEIAFLAKLHRNTCYNAQNNFMALLADTGEFAYLVEERFTKILAQAREELAALQECEAARDGKRGRAA